MYTHTEQSIHPVETTLKLSERIASANQKLISEYTCDNSSDNIQQTSATSVGQLQEHSKGFWHNPWRSECDLVFTPETVSDAATKSDFTHEKTGAQPDSLVMFTSRLSDELRRTQPFAAASQNKPLTRQNISNVASQVIRTKLESMEEFEFADPFEETPKRIRERLKELAVLVGLSVRAETAARARRRNGVRSGRSARQSKQSVALSISRLT